MTTPNSNGPAKLCFRHGSKTSCTFEQDLGLDKELHKLASAAREAGYAEAQADLVLTLMLTDEGKKVLEGLEELANNVALRRRAYQYTAPSQ